MINCLKISEILGDKVVIITCGEDEYIKIWDTKFNLINEFNIRKTGFFQDGTPAIRVNIYFIYNRIYLHNLLIYFHAECPRDI